MRYWPVMSALLAALCAGCGHASPPAPVAFEPCEVPGVETSDSMGRLIRAVGFTFCLPESWRPASRGQDSSDAKQWRGAGGSVTWGLGRPRGFIGEDVEVTVTMPVVIGSNPRPIPQDRPPLCSRKSRPLTPDGVSLVIATVECQNQWTVTALSTQPAIYVQGETRSARVADLLEQIMSTIRFPANRR